MTVDELVDRVQLYNPKSVWLHGYALPFFILYALCAYAWIGLFGIWEYFEFFCIILSIVGVCQLLTALFCLWFVNLHCALNCKWQNDPIKATLAKVQPMSHNGATELVRLRKTKGGDGNLLIWFEFQKVKYILDADEKKQFRSVQFPINNRMGFYQACKGLESDDACAAAFEKYGDNKMEMVIPTFLELFKERATAPFFVFQVFCVSLWCMDEYWYYSLFTLFMLITFEATMVKQQLKYMVEIRNMGNKPFSINVYRSKKWIKCSTDSLIAGDIISVGRSQNENLVPCDLLLLRGSCIVDESMLTGESVPQMKEPIEELEADRLFDFDADSRLHVLFGGTKVVQHNPPSKTAAGLKAPDNGCLGYVLRTGFKTSQGQLLRTILFGVKRVTANNLETFGFILFLLIFAIMAASYVWMKGIQDETRSRYKLFLECTLILTSVVPPELPIELSLAVNSSLLALQKLGVYCTEPFRIPFAGKVDICCFDKTGTLTTDNLVVEGITGLNGDSTIRAVSEAPLESIQVLVTCHSLVQLDDDIVGDPLEKACLQSLDWSLTKNEVVIPKKGKEIPLKIFTRHHFSSNLKRMSVITGYILQGTSDVIYLATVKGAPETLKSMFVDAPASYDEIYQQMTREGARVLALGFKELGMLTHKQIREFSRDDIEKDLRFVGFVVISCPLKPDSKAVIKEIVGSSHQVVIITGDNALTACHVAKELKFTRKKTLILDIASRNDYGWSSIDGKINFEIIPGCGWRALTKEYDLCITGQALAYLTSNHRNLLKELLPYVKVYARMAPKQKEHVVTTLKNLGYTTLMCGDGTNDVGALKHAHVGVALLSHPYIDKDKLKEAVLESKSNKATASDSTAVSLNSPSKAALVETAKKRHPRFSRQGRDEQLAVGSTSPSSSVSATQKKINQMLKQIEEDEKAQLVRLGDASIAAPFTSKYSSIQSICHVIKQGRCTLVTTLQMFKILALNALVLAYSQSVLYLDGIKFSDTQATVQGLLLAACFLFVSRSKPLKTLAKQRPLANIFNFYTLLTVTIQFAVHLTCLLHLVQEAHARSPDREIKLNEEFKPNLLNTTVYIISVTLQVSTFAVNYRGHPFMENLLENKALLYSIFVSLTTVATLTMGLVPDMCAKFELVELPDEFRKIVIFTLVTDFIGCFMVDRILQWIFGDMRIR